MEGGRRRLVNPVGAYQSDTRARNWSTDTTVPGVANASRSIHVETDVVLPTENALAGVDADRIDWLPTDQACMLFDDLSVDIGRLLRSVSRLCGPLQTK